ncbi:PIN domain-containing protein [Microbacterium sp.]|uniref:PIN domain-containing protein n=1 Tax=Microbacterium sp. TaxID=51671 RepID=UPI0039E39D12
MTLFLVDNSVIQRLAKPPVREAWHRLCETGDIATCLPTLLEAGYSARSAEDHGRLVDLELRAKVLLAPHPEIVELALRIQAALFAAGTSRAVGVSDLQIAATALHHSNPARPVIVVHYDADFDHVAAVEPAFRSRWIVPRGTAD